MTAAPPEGPPASPLQEALDILHRYLREHGLRNTQEREAILTHIYESTQEPFSADQLLREVCDQRMKVANATIFYALDLFYHIGLIVRVPMGDKMLYDKCLGEPSVRFFQCCVRCGEVKRLKVPDLAHALEGVPYRRFRPHGVAACSYGTCSKCRAAMERSRKRYLRKIAEKTQ